MALTLAQVNPITEDYWDPDWEKHVKETYPLLNALVVELAKMGDCGLPIFKVLCEGLFGKNFDRGLIDEQMDWPERRAQGEAL